MKHIEVGFENGILSDFQILRRLVSEKPHLLFISPIIDPEHQIGPSSIDVRLGTKLKTIKKFSGTHIDLTDRISFQKGKSKYYEDQLMDPKGYFVLHPGEFALAHTLEYFRLPLDLAARIEGRSSFGRIGLQVHATAGFVDPGFEGTLTYELMNSGALPVKIAPGIRLGQLCFFRVDQTQVGYMDKNNSKYGGKVDVEPSNADREPEIPIRKEKLIKVKGSFGKSDFNKFESLVSTPYKERISFEGDNNNQLTEEKAVAEVAAVIGAIAAVSTLFMTIYDKIQKNRESKEWSKEKLLDIIENQLIIYGIHNYEILDISNYDQMINENKPCVIKIDDSKSNMKYKVTVFWDGDTFVTESIEIE